MTLPWHVSLQEDDCVAIEPVDEIKTLRFDHRRVDALQVGPNAEHAFDGLGGKAIEIEILFDLGTAREAGLCVPRSPDGQEQTRVSVFNQAHSKQNDSLQLDICESSLRTDLVGQPPERAPFRLSRIDPRASSGSFRPVRLRIFIDRSVVEVFADNTHRDRRWAYPRKVGWIFPLFSRQFVGSRVYPTREDSRGISFFARGGVAKVISMDVWQMRSTWPELKHKEGNQNLLGETDRLLRFLPGELEPGHVGSGVDEHPCLTVLERAATLARPGGFIFPFVEHVLRTLASSP